MSIRDQLEGIGLPAGKTAEIAKVVEDCLHAETMNFTKELLHRMMIRLDKDSIEGRALARALGFDFGRSLPEAARSFAVTKQYLHRIEWEFAGRLGDLAGSSRAASTVSKNSRVLPGNHPVTGIKPGEAF